MRFLRSHFQLLQIVSMLIAAVIVATVVSRILISGIRQTEHQICHRLNIHRAADDRNALVEWRVDVLFAFAVAYPAAGSPRQSPAQRELGARFLVLLQADVSAQTWTPLTPDCDHPGNGRLPVRFSVRQPTPQDLTLGPKE